MAANVLFNVPAVRKIRRKEDFVDISKYSDRKLRERFHFGLEAILFISDLLNEKLQRATKRSYALTALQQVLITLRFFASGSFFQCVGDCMGVDKVNSQSCGFRCNRCGCRNFTAVHSLAL